jgi:hypothetical protein
MAAQASVSITGTITGTPVGNQVIGPLTAVSAAACGQVQELVLQSGANTITVPATPAPNGCIIQLPSTNTAVTTLKGVTGDTGIAIGKTGFMMLCFDPTAVPASFVLNSASTQTGLYTYISFF